MKIQSLASGSEGNCYVLDRAIMLECGIRWAKVRQALYFFTNDIEACLVSHEHQDHSKAVKDVMRAGIDCYMSKGTADALNVSGHRLHIIRDMEQFRVGHWRVLPFPTVHDASEPLGFLLASGDEKLLYASDTEYIPHRFKGLTHIMVEANYSLDIVRENVMAGSVPSAHKNRVLQSHMSIDTVKDMLRANDLSKVQQIWLLHLSRGNSDAEAFRQDIQELTGKETRIA